MYNKEKYMKKEERNIKTDRDYKNNKGYPDQSLDIRKKDIHSDFKLLSKQNKGNGLVHRIIKMQKELEKLKIYKRDKKQLIRNSLQLNRIFENHDSNREMTNREMTEKKLISQNTSQILSKIQIQLLGLKRQLLEQIEEKQSLKKQQSDILLELQDQLLNNQKLGQQFRTLQKEESQIKSNLKVLKMENRILKQENEIIKKQMCKKQVEISWRNDKISLMKNEIDQVKNSIYSEVDYLQSILKQQRQMSEKQFKLINDLEEKIKERDGQIRQLRNKLQAHDNKIQLQLQQANSVIERLNQKVSRLQSKTGSLKQCNYYELQEEYQNSSKDEPDQYELMVLNQQINLYQQKLEGSLHREIDLQLDCGRKGKKIQQLKREVQRYRGLQQKMEKYHRDCERISQQVENLQSYILFYEEELNKSEKEIAQLYQMKAEISRGYQEIVVQNRKIKRELITSKQSSQFMSKQISNCQSTISKFVQLLENLNQQLLRLQLRKINSKYSKLTQIQIQK